MSNAGRAGKRAEMPVLEMLIQLLPKLIMFFVLLALVYGVYRIIIPGKTYSAFLTNLDNFATEVNDIQDGETINVPGLRGEYNYLIFTSAEKRAECDSKSCVCISYRPTQELECRTTKANIKKTSCASLDTKKGYVTIKRDKNGVYLEGQCV